ncbi:MAG TPA: acyl-CoA dehydrogenase family protein [Kofleriaceae bacterium]
MDIIRALLAAQPPAAATLAEWWAATAAVRRAYETPVDRALVSAAFADRLGFAFTAGYQAALTHLFPIGDGVYSLCITEATGNSPRDIATTLEPSNSPGMFVMNGRKKWATGAPLADGLIVAAKVGTDAEGRNQIRLARIGAQAPGVSLTPSNAPFVPEIPHAEVGLTNVAVLEADVLPGDGYDEYIKPFRTVEDAHVHAALVGYLIGVARRKRFAREVIERLAALAITTRAAALADAKAASTHVMLGGVFALIAHEVAGLEAPWAASPDEEWHRWQRDRALLQVAGKAREARRAKAWTSFS